METQDIIKYLDNELSNEEKAAFEKKIANDSSLAKEVNALRQMKSYASDRANETKAILASQKIHESYKTVQPAKPKNNSIIKYLIPLAVAAMVVLGIFIRQDNSDVQLTNSELYATYFTPSDLNIVNRSESNQSLEEKAEASFNSGDFITAEKYISELIETQDQNQQLKLYKAISLLHIDKLTEAETLLDLLKQNPNYKSESNYHLALLKIKQLDYAASENYLLQIDEQSFRYKQAQKMISELKDFIEN